MIRLLNIVNRDFSDFTSDPWHLLCDDAQIIVMGSTAISGSYFGRLQIENVLIENILQRVAEIRFDHVETFSSDNCVAMLVRPRGATRAGAPINAAQSVMGVVADFDCAKIRILRLYPDTKDIETTLFGRTFIVRQRSESAVE